MTETNTQNPEPAQRQQLEGPWRKEAQLTTSIMNEQLPNSEMTVREMYDYRYGPGNWKEDKTAHSVENQLGQVATRNEYGLVSEAQSNLAAGNGYVTDDGVSAKSLQRRAWTDMIDLVVSPDGDAHYAEKFKKQDK